MATEVFDISNEIKRAVYNNWHGGNIGSTFIDNTYPKVIGFREEIFHSTQMQHINMPLILRIADEWRLFADRIWQKPFDPLPLSSLDLTSFEKCSLLFTEEIIEFCSNHDILSECLKYHKYFVETFKNIQNITVSVSDDHELSDYRKLCFLITLSDDIDNVLKYENDFKNKIRRDIEKEKRRYFIYNYNLI